MAATALSGSSSRNRWPPPLTTCSRALARREASSRALRTGTLGSSSPATTSVGVVTVCSQGRLDQRERGQRLRRYTAQAWAGGAQHQPAHAAGRAAGQLLRERAAERVPEHVGS